MPAVVPAVDPPPHRDHRVGVQQLAPRSVQPARAQADGLPDAPISADYADHLELLDQQVGELLQALQQRGDASNTAVTVCSDHGELLGDWGLLLKGCFLEGAIRSLFLHRPPGGRRGLRRLWRSDRRPYGLTESLWAAQHAVRQPADGSFGHHLRQMPKQVSIAFAEEEITLQ